MTLCSTAADVERKPHPVPERDSIHIEMSVAPVAAEGVPLDAIHPESQPLVEAKVVDVGRRRSDYNSNAALQYGALKN